METQNFELREWQLSDAKSLAEHANNINIWNSVRDYFPHPYLEEDGKHFIEMVLNNPHPMRRTVIGQMPIEFFSDLQPPMDFAIVVDGNAVGGIGIVPQKDVERITAEIGYWLGEKYWNRGIMSEAVKRMVKYAFANFELQKLYAPVFDFNIASQKVLQKAGFEREAILKQAAIKNGKIIDMHYYSLFKSI